MTTPPSGPAPGAAAGSTKPGPRQPAEALDLPSQGSGPGVPADEGLSRDEEDTLVHLQAKAARAAAGGSVATLKVEEPHSELHYGGVRVTGDWTEVPQHMVPAIEAAAADSGVTLTQKES